MLDFRTQVSAAAADAGDRVTLSYFIDTEAVPAASPLEVSGETPVLGGSWAGARVWPRDSDGDAVADGSQPVAASLSVASSGNASYYANCETLWAGAEIQIRCDVPDVTRAGAWTLSVAIDGVVVADGVRQIPVACRRGSYEQEEVCKRCLDGALCTSDGITVTSLPLRTGRWRSDEASTRLRKCLHSEACLGGELAGDESCAEGYNGSASAR